MTTGTLGTWEDIHTYAKQFSEPGWIFRGQRIAASSKLELSTSIERICDRLRVPPDRRRATEARLFREFRRTYHNYSRNVPDAKAIVEWLALMQHHGAPTRLLDFTYSIYVAAYFATDRLDADTDSEIWAFYGPRLQQCARALLIKAGKHPEDVNQIAEPFNEGDEQVVSTLICDDPFAAVAWPINAFRLNERLRIQQGIFLIAGDVSQPFMSNLNAVLDASDASRYAFRLTIPYDVGRHFPRRLFSMGISRTTLFPGLDGYSGSLAVWNPVYDPIDWKGGIV